jgi:transposase
MEQIENISLRRPRYDIRLEHLARWHRIRARCFCCGHVAILHPDGLRRRFTDHAGIVALERRLRCTACGNRAHNTMEIGRIARD